MRYFVPTCCSMDSKPLRKLAGVRKSKGRNRTGGPAMIFDSTGHPAVSKGIRSNLIRDNMPEYTEYNDLDYANQPDDLPLTRSCGSRHYPELRLSFDSADWQSHQRT